MPIKALYCCDFCTNETIAPNENWHRLVDIKPIRGTTYIGEPVILCNSCKDHLLHRFDKK